MLDSLASLPAVAKEAFLVRLRQFLVFARVCRAGTARFASDARIENPACGGFHDLVSFVKSLYVLLYCGAQRELFIISSGELNSIRAWWKRAIPADSGWGQALTCAERCDDDDFAKVESFLLGAVCPMA